MKILILTQTNPVNVASVYDEIYHEFSNKAEIFSPQIMAILGELSLKESPDDFKHSYRVLNAAFVKNIKAATDKMNSKKPWIIIGNCDQSSIKFDHVIGFDGGSDFGNEENFDLYIQADKKMLKEANYSINYYNREDAEHFFPTMRHLKLFINTIIERGNKNSNSTK